MDARVLLRQIFYTVVSFLYINGDSEFGLNSDRPFDVMSAQMLPQTQNIYQNPSLKRNFSNLKGPQWPFVPGPGQNANFLLPPMAPAMIPGGIIRTIGGKLPVNGILGLPGMGGQIGHPGMKGIAGNTAVGGMMGNPAVEGIVSQKVVGGPSVGLPIPDGSASIQQSTVEQMSAAQQLSMSQSVSGQIELSGGKSWKGLAPLQPGAVAGPARINFQQIPSYGYDKPASLPLPKPLPAPVTSLPVPGIMPGILKQPEVPADPLHGLPLNHLYVNIPLLPSVAAGPNIAAQINHLTSDIIIVIDGSPQFGFVDAGGKALWNPLVVQFVTQFINQVILGPQGNRIGVVLVSFGIDDMIPLTFDKQFLLQSLNNLRPTFGGGCSGKGIGTANNLFFQYGRPTAVKRVVFVTDGSPLCSFRSMAESKYAARCGIDVVNVVIGGTIQTQLPPTAIQSQWFITGKPALKLIWEPIMKRMLMRPIHGGWSIWSAWNQCSMLKSCNIGYQQRFRVCDNPSPMYGGVRCFGYPIETRMCYPNLCIDTTIGYWTRWTEWSTCSVPCGIGSQTRSRNCITLAGQPSPTCRGKYAEIRDCMMKECPVPGGWSAWSTWGLCSVPCGMGMKLRVRQCDSPAPKYGGKSCEGVSVEELACDTKRNCAIDGGFGPWSAFGPCSALCGEGERIRSRECNNPIPQFGGRPCDGLYVDKEICGTKVPCPIDGNWGVWGEYSLCSVTCGSGIQSRERLCNSPPAQFGGEPCHGPSMEEITCDTLSRCAVHGMWSLWTDFTPCVGPCGMGTRSRSRKCNNPIPMHGGKDCPGIDFIQEKCDTGHPCPIDGGWGLWSVWSVCPVKCGTGIITRQRECDSPIPQFGGSFCVGPRMEEKVCDKKVSCPVHGRWSVWMPWSYCSASCGKGKRQRHRLCNNPAPDFGGLSCDGHPLEKEACNTKIPCPIAGGWSEWIVVDTCNVQCGTGLGKRVRKCNNPAPMFGGPDCIGPEVEFFDCVTGKFCPINGGWSLWGLWSECSVTCGTGEVIRSRYCASPPPQFGGEPCSGPNTETQICKTGLPCQVDGHWSSWTTWSVCSATCGEGVSLRERTCNNPAPMFGGRPCQGPDMEEMMCVAAKPCPIDGGWSEWTILSACSVTCGNGIMIKTRICNFPPPQFGGAPCSGIDMLEVDCKTGVPCPVHGGWGPWSLFTVCSVTCGKGTKERIRACDSPAPAFGGDMCLGDLVQVRPCNTGVFCPIPGGWSGWSPYTPCSKTCGTGIERRTRTCTNPLPQYGGPDCMGNDVEERLCHMTVKCPVDGNWGDWGIWGKCSVTCGPGFQQRLRLCNNPAPVYGGGDCPGSPIDERHCDAPTFCPVHGMWGQWSEYSKCSETCGSGFKIRVRICDSPFPQYGGRDCKGLAEEKIPCDTLKHCPVHGQWASWSAWEACSVVCGEGMTRRYRDCSNPPPMYGGSRCRGKDMQVKTCFTGINCPIHGDWGKWGEYIACSVTCGVGLTQRFRICDSPAPMYGGDFCIGDNTQTIDCDAGVACPIDGGLSMWSKWSLCSVSCGQGLRTRSRLCNSPAPMFGGADCVGALFEEEICFADVYCPIHGLWSLWSGWSQCSATCGMGMKKRDRVCNSPAPMYGGWPCKGEPVDVMPCDSKVFCPLDGGWSFWTLWGECSVTCGVGTKMRTRECSNPIPNFGGKQCKGEKAQEKICNTGIYCAQDGGWGFWSEWSQCNATCGEGFSVRIRLCNNPPPLHGGSVCMGPKKEHISCDSGIPCPVHGNWGAWEMWGSCSATCGLGMQRRIRLCSNPAPSLGGSDCNGDFEQFRQCETGFYCPVDGNWGQWSKFSKCSVTCGEGFITRHRLCDSPSPQNGGKDCTGHSKEEVKCDTFTPCSVHGGWSYWGEWGTCSVTCGYGQRSRFRTCTNPSPLYGGFMCKGPAKETVECGDGMNCPINGQWSMWLAWTACSATCGFGKRERLRECTSPKPQYGGLPCEGLISEVEDCKADILCPVDGQWSVWSLFGECSATCGVGIKVRMRYCDSPPPVNGGKQCVGPAEDIIECVSKFTCTIDGGWSAWGEFSYCSASCGNGVKKRERYCDSPAPQFGGQDCLGSNIEKVTCKSGIACPVDGGFTFWSAWSLCSVTCGFGFQLRTRTCTNPAPLHGGRLCMGPLEEYAECDAFALCPVNGEWSLWSEWDVCDAKCGISRQKRFRTCSSPKPQNGGLFCKGLPEESRVCFSKQFCPIDGGWSSWSKWGACQGNCGKGQQYRSRTCTEPEPRFGGADCKGNHKDSRTCDTGTPCIVVIDGQWSSWGFWSKCSASCGEGTQSRHRFCDNPAPMNGGTDCTGNAVEEKTCFAELKCGIDGGWSKWSMWSKCSASCGKGVQVRLRYCDSPIPLLGGKNCQGLAEERRECVADRQCDVDGGWSAWGFWSKCSVSCGKGLQIRLRYCNNPSPIYMLGGRDCKGYAEETRTCIAVKQCGVDGHWSKWGIWSKCSASCGEGIQVRIRRCDNPKPMIGGKDCHGFAQERRECFADRQCGIDGDWSSWGIWSKCSVTCGEGFQIRLRYCNNPSPMYMLGGRDCKGFAEETRTCTSDRQCGVNGDWSKWGIWSKCSASCGEGVQVRVRYCDSPKPMLGGKDCQGLAEEKRTCMADRQCGIDGGWSSWGYWSFCSVSCGEGYQIRLRYCNSPSPRKGGRDCLGVGEERRTCRPDALCAVDGEWSWWTKWSACTTTCGEGIRERRRFCDNPMPQNGGRLCVGADVEQAPCKDNPACTSVWSEWLGWQRCDCNTGKQERIRICKGLTGCSGQAKMERNCDPKWLVINCPQGEWQMWSSWSLCTGSCGQGVRERVRDCIDINTGAISTVCKGLHTEIEPCKFKPCAPAEWGLWAMWSSCSATCGQGVRERTRICVDTVTGVPRKDCIGLSTEIVSCEALPCPTLELNCSTECKWDNGIGYAVYPGDCSMFVQCDSLYGHPLVQQCPWGLLWSLDALQCTRPHMSECDKCSKIRHGEKRSYYSTCRSYWTCPNGVPVAHCCKKGYRFDHKVKDCVLDAARICTDDCPPREKIYKSKCTFRKSAVGSTWYEQEINHVWTPRPCPAGTHFIRELCECAYLGNNGTLPAKEECLPELHLTFSSLAKDLQRNDGIHIENVQYLGDGTAYFDGTAVVNSNIFSNAEWGRNVFVYIRFKPQGHGRRQGLVHNSGCGPSDIGPSVFIGLDRVAGGMDMKFSTVPQTQGVKYEFVNITTPDNKFIDAWFKFSPGTFRADVNGMTAVLDLPGANAVSRRHGALNIGGNLCRIGNESFGGFIGILDEVKIYKCKPVL